MSESFSAAVLQGKDGSVSVTLAGAIDEEADLESLFSQLDADAVFSMAGVDRLNSIGVHRWVPLIAALSKKRRVYLDGLSYPVVMQANCVANLFGDAVVRSCMCPYFCPGCRDNQIKTVEVAEIVEAGGKAPPKSCGRCGARLEFDELDSYFAFIRR